MSARKLCLLLVILTILAATALVSEGWWFWVPGVRINRKVRFDNCAEYCEREGRKPKPNARRTWSVECHKHCAAVKSTATRELTQPSLVDRMHQHLRQNITSINRKNT